MAYLVHSGLLAFSRKKSFCFGLIMYPFLTKLIRSTCVDADLGLEVCKSAKTKKKKRNKRKKEEPGEELRNYPTVSFNHAYTCIVIEVHVRGNKHDFF